MGGALPDNVIAMPARAQRMGNGAPGPSRKSEVGREAETPAIIDHPQAAARAARDS